VLLATPATSNDRSVDLGSPAFTRTLGLIWYPMLDTIGFAPVIKDNISNSFTKRQLLAQVMRIYDPLGILAPIVVKGRILFQNLWRKNLGWDEVLSEADQLLWREWFDSLKLILEFQVPRCYNLNEYIDIELHVFCDASELAHAAVSYWRYILANGEVKLALIASKARVSPLKPASIPRLELQGALIATRLANTICQAHRSKPSRRVFWCDSMTVLGWLRNDARNYKPFVAHRVGEITESSNVSEWRWVPTEHNVSDDATRGKCGIESRWISGPDFLRAPASEWPTELQITGSTTLGQEELKPSHRHHTSVDPSHLVESINLINLQQIPLPVVVNISHFSSWIRLVRATAVLHRFISVMFKKRVRTFNNLWVQDVCLNNSRPTASVQLDSGDISRAERHILAWSQVSAFGEELLCLQRGQPIHKKSRLATLTPVLREGILYLVGRNSAVTKKQPIILDAKEPAVRLLIAHYHCKFAHANTETVINELRQEFWILGLRNAVRFVRHHCQLCKLLKDPVLQPPMGDLPEARLSHNQRPFTFVGVDYFGPITVSIGRRREKRWVALYTCLVTRAVHLEIVVSLSADSAIMCLRRLISRRGTPNTIYSDNGTSFVGASRQIRALYEAAVHKYAAERKIKWHFISPSAPFMGGAWERLVRSVKTALKVTLRERAPHEEVLATLLAEAEAIVNARPLTHVSADADCPEALTPNHFLLGDSSGRSFPEEDLSDAVLVGRSSWRKAQRLADHFWRRWVTEYLPTLAPRSVPGTKVSINVGDPVLIGDGDLPRGSWPRGVIVTLFPGRDGVVRVADVRTAAGLLRRPLRKLVPL
jgi:transposase InsO family protein